jgi:hypothetical protein
MEANTRFSKRIVALVALLATSLATAVSFPVRAADDPAVDYEVGNALICDTQAQAERFVALFSGDAPAAIGVVNAEQHDPTACAIANVAYVRGASLGTARNRDTAFEIVRILVIGVEAENAIRTVRPAANFSLPRVKEFAV